MGLGNATAAANIAQGNQFSNMIGQGAGLAALAFSDERLKTNVSVIDPKDIKEFRKNLTPYLFEYISKEHGEGQWAGVMAQDLEKSKLGKLIVVEDKDGNKHNITEIVASEIRMVGGKHETEPKAESREDILNAPDETNDMPF